MQELMKKPIQQINVSDIWEVRSITMSKRKTNLQHHQIKNSSTKSQMLFHKIVKKVSAC